MIRLRLVLFVIFILSAWGSAAASAPPAASLSIIAPAPLLADPVARSAVDDSLALLKQAFPAARVSLNDRTARVALVLTAPAARGGGSVADDAYAWRSERTGGRIVLREESRSSRGTAAALYGLLQERLGFRFYHPARTIVPHHRHWPLPDRFTWEAAPRFATRGFHLHTLHPIELTEQLHDPTRPGALADVQGYIDWLARNGQNTMQFYLLRDVDRRRWPPHARAIVEYAHRRGVAVGVEFSLCMLQQQAFQLFKPLRPVPYRRQVDRTLAWLFQVPWDFVSVELAMGEYLPDLGGVLTGLKGYLVQEITGRYRTRVMEVTHVIRSREERADESAGATPPPTEPEKKNCGVLIHTVMCYSATEPKAPVYGNVNQRFMMERARRESLRRETWYWPESAYWVAFDNSVPLFLLPYLEARWSDMESMEKAGVPGHLTFTSGWEWGYWLTDWSIARWSWRFRANGSPVPTTPLSVLGDLAPTPRLRTLWQEALQVQTRYLKEHELLRYLAALAPFSELPPPFNEPFQPEPPFRYGWLISGASDREADAVLKGPVALLEEYASVVEDLVTRIEREMARERERNEGGEEERGLCGELVRGMRVTALRARHRALTIRGLVAQRAAPHWWQPAGSAAKECLARAAALREEGLTLVREQEAGYRYPLPLIARRRPDHTAYDFGYLYPASDLFFWRREEEQVRQRRFDALFMKLWNFRKTLGLESLLF
ncbi:hypothetical protein [Geobacter pickeringii]|uniref:Alpha glucuronidase N-terminal domain-containing protein n=1 Tax=Geobacter pickeringii TaxID=345632 RepID=A0A0B5BDD2_9BACT|nr:hypothetical protein [Geobacter pickeringii]AJE03129.1 hypothetical protein GPICK_06905 [Geobacter pickeringii]